MEIFDMVKFIIGCLLLLLSKRHISLAQKYTTCERQYSKIGCYEESNAKQKDLLFNDRENVNWHKIVEFMHHVACKCDEAARSANKARSASGQALYAGFSLHYWGECYGKTRDEIEALTGRDTSKRCNGNQEYTGCFEHHQECVGHANAEYIYKLKDKAEKDVDGDYTEWESWTSCKGNCGIGLKIRERTCTNPLPKGEGADCSSLGSSTESAACDTGKPCPVDGEYGPWGAFSNCTKKCGGGTQQRSRSCNKPEPTHGGDPCEGPESEYRPCNDHKCQIDGGYSKWSSYSSCSKTCGTGKKTRYRSCTNPPPQYGGKDCRKLGVASQTVSCKESSCLSRIYVKKACEGGTVHLQCSGGSKIKITKALYGRKTTKICKGGFSFAWKKNCKSKNSLSKVRSTCHGKSSCSVAAKNSVFGDPCKFTRKYLVVKYRCKD